MIDHTVKRNDVARLRYMGFNQTTSIRAYKFERVETGAVTLTFIITADVALFTKHRIGIQEGPSLCMSLLAGELETPETAGQMRNHLEEQDVLSYLASRPVPGARRPPKRTARPSTVAEAPLV